MTIGINGQTLFFFKFALLKCKMQIVPLHIIFSVFNLINKSFGNVFHTKDVFLTLDNRKLI